MKGHVLLFSEKKYKEALKVAKEALKVAEETFGPNDSNVASSLRLIGNIYHEQGKYAEAEQYYKKAIVIQEKEKGQDDYFSHWIAYYFIDLAKLYFDQGKYKEAEQLYKKALQLLENAPDPKDDDYGIAKILASLARLYFSQGKCVEAEPFFKRSSSMFDTFGEKNDLHILILDNMADCYKKSGKTSEAKVLEERANEIRSIDVCNQPDN